MTGPTDLQAANHVICPPSGIVRRWGWYLAERFPVIAHGLLILSFYSSNQFLAHALTEPGHPMRYDLSSLLGSITMFLLFLQLRVFDDHKDYARDCQHYPDRLLSRGIVTLVDLKWLAVLTLLGQFCCALLRGPAALAAVATVNVFSFLMLKEFFAGEFLQKRFLLYASTHMLIIPLMAMMVFSFATDRFPWEAPLWYWVYSTVGYFVAFNWEISRKIRTPGEEVEGIDSYTKRFGTYGAAYAVLLIRLIDTALVCLVASHLGMSSWFYILVLGLFLVCMIGFVQYRFQTSPATARRMMTYASFYIVAFDLALAVELGRTYGVTLGGIGS